MRRLAQHLRKTLFEHRKIFCRKAYGKPLNPERFGRLHVEIDLEQVGHELPRLDAAIERRSLLRAEAVRVHFKLPILFIETQRLLQLQPCAAPILVFGKHNHKGIEIPTFLCRHRPRSERQHAHAVAGARYSASSICEATPSCRKVSSYSSRRNGSSSQYGMAVPPSVTSIAPSSVSFSPGTPALSLRWLLGPYQPIRRSGSLLVPKCAWNQSPP